MPTSRNDTRVQCPFYHFDESRNKNKVYRITCEGITDGSSLMLTYRRKKDFQIQLDTFCCQYFDRCELYQMLLAKYREGI